jgi:spore coat polysaccharide biosynthesis protein SpsF
MLAWVVNRTRRAGEIDEVTVATTHSPDDDLIITECRALEVRSHRGSEFDVLDRYHEAAAAFEAEVVVRITSDCPLIDPDVIDQVVSAFNEHRVDYASNTLTRTFPRGLDVEAFSRVALETAWRDADRQYQRVHVTPYLYQNPDRFSLHAVIGDENHSDLRWTVDTAEDLEVVRGIAEAAGGRDDFGWREALEIVQRNPRLTDINRSVRQKALEEG